MMALSQQSRKHLLLLIDCLQEQQNELQGVLDQFIKQTVTRAQSWLEAPDQGYMSFDDIHVMLSGASGKLLETINLYTDSTKSLTTESVVQVKSVTKQCEKYPVALNETVNSTKVNEEIYSRLEALEDFISTLKKPKVVSKEEVNEMKQWKEAVTIQQQEMEAGVENIIQKQNAKIKKFSKQLKEVNKKISEITQDITALKNNEIDLVNKLTTVTKSLEHYMKKLAHLNSVINKIYNTIDNNNHEILELTKLTDKSKESQSQTLLTVEKKLEKIEIKYGVVSNILLQRLLPIEKLLQVINTQEVSKVGKCSQLHALQDDIATLKAEVLAMSLKTQQKTNVIGFSASFTCDVPLNKIFFEILKGFNDITLNKGNHFNPTSGVFTAPVDGLYIASFCFTQLKQGSIDVNMVHSELFKGSKSTVKNVSFAKTTIEHSTTVCCTAVLMKKGETLHLEILSKGKTSLSPFSIFTCFLISF